MTLSTNTQSLIEAFEVFYGASPSGIAEAPGRVNLIGEHTDYNEGFVLPCALEFTTKILFKPRNDGIITVRSNDYPDECEQFSIDKTISKGQLHWGDYVRAVAFVFQRAGHTLCGFDMLIDSNVPQGSGLSSSAALQVAIGGMFNDVCKLGLSKAQIALFGQAAENDFIDCQCGVMDQMVSACGEKDHALLLDCKTLAIQKAHIPEDLVVVIVNSNYPRKLVDSEYNARREDCESAAKIMRVGFLRDATMAMLDEVRDHLSLNEYKRAKHVITENERVLQAAQALEKNDIQLLRELMSASHQSLKHDFEITVPATDGLVQICTEALQDRGAARMTGGGFGGAIVCLCREQDIGVIKGAVEQHYTARFGLNADIYVCHAGDGLRIEYF